MPTRQEKTAYRLDSDERIHIRSWLYSSGVSWYIASRRLILHFSTVALEGLINVSTYYDYESNPRNHWHPVFVSLLRILCPSCIRNSESRMWRYIAVPECRQSVPVLSGESASAGGTTRHMTWMGKVHRDRFKLWTKYAHITPAANIGGEGNNIRKESGVKILDADGDFLRVVLGSFEHWRCMETDGVRQSAGLYFGLFLHVLTRSTLSTRRCLFGYS